MAPIYVRETPGPVRRPLIEEIIDNWNLANIEDSLPGRLIPVVNGTRSKALHWGMRFLTRLRDLSRLSKGRDFHANLRNALGSRIDERRASRKMTHEQWVILEDLDMALELEAVVGRIVSSRGLRGNLKKAEIWIRVITPKHHQTSRIVHVLRVEEGRSERQLGRLRAPKKRTRDLHKGVE